MFAIGCNNSISLMRVKHMHTFPGPQVVEAILDDLDSLVFF